MELKTGRQVEGEKRLEKILKFLNVFLFFFLCWLLLLIRMMACIRRWMSLSFLLYLSNATRCLLSLSFVCLLVFFSVWNSGDTSHSHALFSSTRIRLAAERSWWLSVSHRLGFLLLFLSLPRRKLQVITTLRIYQVAGYEENWIPKRPNIYSVSKFNVS